MNFTSRHQWPACDPGRMRRTVCVLGALLVGCITFNGGELPKIELGEPLREPTAVVEILAGSVDRTINGSHAYAGKPDPVEMVRTSLDAATNIAHHWKLKKLIREVAEPRDRIDRAPTHTLRVMGTIDEQKDIGLESLSNTTLAIVPYENRVVASYDVILERISDGALWRVPVSNSVEVRWQVLYLVALPIGGPFWGWRSDADRALYLYSELLARGAFDGHVARRLVRE